jgi:hypothetical protein
LRTQVLSRLDELCLPVVNPQVSKSSLNYYVSQLAQLGDENGPDTALWTDPYSGAVFVLDRRTGNSYRAENITRSERDEERHFSSCRRLSGDNGVEKDEPPEWIKQVLGVCSFTLLRHV